jgi:hypothetical protein
MSHMPDEVPDITAVTAPLREVPDITAVTAPLRRYQTAQL